MPILIASFLYFLIVFGTGFFLGPIRILVLEPMLGPVAAVHCEVPLLIAVMVTAARWLPAKVRLPMTLTALSLMGVGALVFQQFADFAVGVFIRGLTPSQILATFATPAGAIYALSLAAIVARPVLVHRQYLSPQTRR